jgi:hypothetical protein
VIFIKAIIPGTHGKYSTETPKLDGCAKNFDGEGSFSKPLSFKPVTSAFFFTLLFFRGLILKVTLMSYSETVVLNLLSFAAHFLD